MPLRQKVLTGWVVVFTALTFYGLRENRHLGVQGREAHDAICTFRADLARRIDETRDFLKAHPDGLAGISAADLERSIAGQESTLRSLTIRNCPGG